MTLETAKRIKAEGYVHGKDVSTYKQYELLNKEAEAILRGGMNICEEQTDGSRKYMWIKVKPTKTDEESSIELAMRNHQTKKHPRKNRLQEETTDSALKPQLTPPTPPDTASEGNEAAPLYRLASIIKRKLNEFVKIMDDLVDE